MIDKFVMDHVRSRASTLLTERSSHQSRWQDVETFIAPNTLRLNRSDRNKGDNRAQRIINETATFAQRTLESGLMAGMSSPARPWFLLGPPDPEMREFGPVKQWLDTVTRLMRDAFARSNLYSVLPTTYGSCGLYATAAFGVQEDDQEIFRSYPFPVGSFAIDVNERMQVDTIVREYSASVRQLVSKYGLANVSQSVRGHWDRGNYGVFVDVTQVIEPNFDRKRGMLDSRDKAFIAVTFENGNSSDKESALSIKGFDEFPVLVPRWHVNGEDAYGTRCPAFDCLGSVKALQLEEKRKYQGIDRLIRPSMVLPAMLRNSGSSLEPGGTVWDPTNGQNPQGIRPTYEINPRLAELLGDIKEVEYRIKRAFYEDVMLMFATRDPNTDLREKEVEQLAQEKLLVLGPLMERWNDDLFDPLIDRTFNVMMRRGLFPSPPIELQGNPLRVEYTSVMAQAQKLIGVAGVERFIGFVGNLAATTGRPELLDKVDLDQTVDEYAEMTGVPAKIVVTDDKVLAIRKQRAKDIEAEKMAAAMPALRDAAAAAKTAGEVDIEGVTSLQRLLTGQTQ